MESLFAEGHVVQAIMEDALASSIESMDGPMACISHVSNVSKLFSKAFQDIPEERWRQLCLQFGLPNAVAPPTSITWSTYFRKTAAYLHPLHAAVLGEQLGKVRDIVPRLPEALEPEVLTIQISVAGTTIQGHLLSGNQILSIPAEEEMTVSDLQCRIAEAKAIHKDSVSLLDVAPTHVLLPSDSLLARVTLQLVILIPGRTIRAAMALAAMLRIHILVLLWSHRTAMLPDELGEVLVWATRLPDDNCGSAYCVVRAIMGHIRRFSIDLPAQYKEQALREAKHSTHMLRDINR